MLFQNKSPLGNITIYTVQTFNSGCLSHLKEAFVHAFHSAYIIFLWGDIFFVVMSIELANTDQMILQIAFISWWGPRILAQYVCCRWIDHIAVWNMER